MSNQVKADELTAKYIRLRDFKAAVESESKEKLARIKEHLDTIEAEMMTFLNATGQESCKTALGTFFKKTSQTAKVADRDAFLAYVMEHEAIQFLTNHVSADAVKEFVAEHGTVPPGVDVVLVTSVSVNRPKAR